MLNPSPTQSSAQARGKPTGNGNREKSRAIPGESKRDAKRLLLDQRENLEVA